MKKILFDLDGTITDSFEGITKCVQYALKHKGIEVENLDNLRSYIGPPLKYSFQKNYDFDDETTSYLIEKYRERFDKVGIFENRLYDGVEECLKDLKEKGYPLALASSKPEEACKKILEKHGLDGYFDEIVGATLDERISTKQEVLQEVFRRMKVENPRECLLIGDTIFDVEGAKEAGMECIGVSYGFGDKKEMEQAGALVVCDNLKEVEKYIEQYQD